MQKPCEFRLKKRERERKQLKKKYLQLYTNKK